MGAYPGHYGRCIVYMVQLSPVHYASDIEFMQVWSKEHIVGILGSHSTKEWEIKLMRIWAFENNTVLESGSHRGIEY